MLHSNKLVFETPKNNSREGGRTKEVWIFGAKEVRHREEEVVERLDLLDRVRHLRLCLVHRSGLDDHCHPYLAGVGVTHTTVTFSRRKKQSRLGLSWLEILNISLLIGSVCVASELMSVQIEDAEEIVLKWKYQISVLEI